MNSSFFITINSFIGLPPIKQLLPILFKNEKNYCIQCNIGGFENFFEKSYIRNRTIINFKSSKSFNSQELKHKIIKYIKLPLFFLPIYFFDKSDKRCIYTTDLYSLLISIFFKRKSTKIIYLQYEMIEPNKLNRLDAILLKLIQKRSRKIDIILTPEKNRTEYLKKIFFKSNIETFLTIPNTNNAVRLNFETSNLSSKTVVTHIGAIGLDHHIKSYLKAIAVMDSSKYEFRFIGTLKDNVVELIESFNKSHILYIGQVLHSDLEQYYKETDIGVILYKDVSLNHRYCAPNKLYEYWSYGIPVLGDKLPGLKGVFTKPFLGELIDMNISSKISNSLYELSLNCHKKEILNFFHSDLRLDNYINKLTDKLN